MKKVVVTGIGIITPLGFGRERNWAAVIGSKSAIKAEGGFLSARVENLDVPDEARVLSMAFLASAEAIEDSGIDFNCVDASRFGCCVSVSKPGIIISREGKLSIPEIATQSTLAGQLANVFKLKGPVRNITAACATGTNSVIIAADWIKHDICDIAICGAAESSINDLYLAGFKQMGVLAKNKVCPFDRDREGFAISEGSGVLILESYDFAIRRGAKIYGEINAGIMANDATHPIAFEPQGKTIARAINDVLSRAGFDDAGYINMHGTGTRLNDVIETLAIKQAFGRRAQKISLSSTKAATGHMLGASGAVEIAFCLLAIRDQVVPPTLNLYTRDPECSLDYTPNTARQKKLSRALSFSFGFGGQIGIIAVSGKGTGYRV